jgi:polar amino acid transport system permease protein
LSLATNRAPRKLGALSPAPASRVLATVGLVLSVAALAAVAVLGGSLSTSAESSSTSPVFGLVLSTVGIVLAALIVWIGIRAFRASLRSSREAAAADVLAARKSADASRQDSLITISLVFALIIAILMVMLIFMNDGSIQKTFLKWDLIASSSMDVIKAFGLNLYIAVVAQAFVLIFGLVLAVARVLPGRAGKPIRALAIAYIDVMRAVPAIIVLYLVGFGLPLAQVPFLSSLDTTGYAIIALTLTYSAYVAETYRAGIEAIHPSQIAASRSLGLSFGQTLRHVTLPQAVRYVIPPLLSSFIALQKDTSLVNIIGAMDAFNQAKIYASNEFNLSSVTVVAALFVIITIPQTRFVDWILARGALTRKGGKK